MTTHHIILFTTLIHVTTLVFSAQEHAVPDLDSSSHEVATDGSLSSLITTFIEQERTHLHMGTSVPQIEPGHASREPEQDRPFKKARYEDQVVPKLDDAASKRPRLEASSTPDRTTLQDYLAPLSNIITIPQRQHTVYKVTTKGIDRSGCTFLYENYFWINQHGVDIRRSRNYRFWSPTPQTSYDRKKIASLQRVQAIYNNDVIMIQYNLIKNLDPTLPKIMQLLRLTCLEVATPETVFLLNSCHGNYADVLFKTPQGKVAKRLTEELGVIIAHRDIRWQDGILTIPINRLN